ncbi:CCA-adding enzyme [uncultured archaeon]|nr:CCA-adding enzyme [uncultured archaeon]
MITGRNYQKVFDAVLKEVKPSANETAKERIFIGKIVAKLDKITPEDVRIELAGSTAKGTNLRGDRDFDIFMLFSKNYSVKDLMTLGMKYAKEFAKGHRHEVAYAEHPYLRVWVEGSEVDIVPSYKIEDISERMTSVDRSPLHTKYVNSRITDAQRDDVRLLKRFMKAIGVYGAEGKIRGFSGYMCELLILRHGSFTELLDEATRWRGVPVFNLTGPESEETKGRFKDAAMVFIDPVDPDRNVAAAVSKTSISMLMHSAKMFLRKPGIRAFFPDRAKFDAKWMAKQLKMRDSMVFGVEFARPKDLVEDILWPQLYKFAAKTAERLRDNGFEVFDSDVCANGKCMIMFELSVHHLPEMRKIVGPPLWCEEDVETFIREHDVTEPIWFENDRILAVGKRKFSTADKVVKDVLARPAAYGVPPDVKKVIKTSKMLTVSDIAKRYPEFLFAYLKKRNVP